MKRKTFVRVLALMMTAAMSLGEVPVFATVDDQAVVSTESQSEDLENVQEDSSNEENSSVETENSQEEQNGETQEENSQITEGDVIVDQENSDEDEIIVEDSYEGAMLLSNLEFVSETHDTFSRTTSTIAPGVTQDVCYAYAKDGKQMVYYVATADITRDDVDVYANYKDNQCTTFGMSKLTEQMASAEERNTTDTTAPNYNEYYTAVAGVNADFYNMTTGRPSGAFVMEGTITNTANNRPFFAILKDGTPVIGANNSDWALIADQVEEAVGGSQVLVKDGKDVTANASGSYNTERHSRTCVGYTADGKVVMMVLDGRQEPFSCGGTMHELAQIMLEAGCVAAINLDGGGSSTFVARQEGENEVSIVNRPSDGSERSISSSLMIVSTAVPSDVFERASLKADKTYVTPGSTVNVTATGVSPAGTSAEIPEGASWQLEDSAYGTIIDGVFTSNGTTGDVVVQMTYGENVVGETTIHVVIPDTLKFDSENMTVPFDKSVEISMTATYGLNEVVMKDGDVIFTLAEEEIGTIQGFTFTAASEDSLVTESSITAILVANESVTATSVINLGKGSDILFDFEDGEDSGFYLADEEYNYVWPEGDVKVVNSSTGKVHSGENALEVNIDYSNSLESGYQRHCLRVTEGWEMKNATRLGMWIYIPDEAVALWARWQVSVVSERNEDGTIKTYGSTITGEEIDDGIVGKTGYVSSFEESGWHYLSIDLSGYSDCAVKDDFPIMQFYISDRDGESFGYNHNDYKSLNSNFTFYIDDITIDYSSAVDDREAPVFESIRYADGTMSDAVTLNGQTVTSGNVISFGAIVHENTDKTNYTGLDESTAKAYIDGVEVPCAISGGIMSIADVELADGLHHVKFSICDKMGNYASMIRTINISTGSDKSTVKVVAHDESLDKILLGSLYYVDVVADNVENVKEVKTVLDLNNISIWELEHMEVADGFEVSYSVQDDENIATLTINRVGNVTESGEATLVSIPVRTWELKMGYTYANGTKAGNTAYTYAQYRTMKEFWPIDISVEIDFGLVTFLDGTTTTFSGETVQVDTEMWAEDAYMISTTEGLAYYNSWNGGHIHNATAVDDKAATCTEDGYTGRTFCDECNSIVDWGTKSESAGHTYVVIDGSLQCECGECISESGLVEVNEDTFYMINGVLKTGWVTIGSNSYYFGSDYKAVDGEQTIDGYKFTFKEKILYEGQFVTTSVGLQYRWANAWAKRTWFTYRDNTYYADLNSCVVSGLTLINLSNNGYEVHLFDSDGKYINQATEDGLVVHLNDAAYIKDGLAYYAGLVQDTEGNYYYINSTLKAVKNCEYAIGTAKANGLLPAGTYTFGADGKMVNPPTEETSDGLRIDEDGEIRYYVDGVAQYAGLVQDTEGNYYYINSTLKAVKNCEYAIGTAKTNGLLPAGTYVFGADGKMVL